MYVFGDSFDLYAATVDMYAGYWEYAGNPSGYYGITGPGRFGGRCLYSYWQGSLSGSPAIFKSSGANDAVHHITCAFSQSAGISGTTLGFSLCLMDGATNQCSINFRSDGAITLTSGLFNGTVLATYPGAVLASSQWHVFEIEVVINNTTGSFTVRSAGSATNSFQATGLNTRGGSANNYANKLAIHFGGAVNYQYLDDLLWRSDPSSVPWIGDVRSYTRMPVSDQSVQFAHSTTPAVVVINNGIAQQTYGTPNTAHYARFVAGASGLVTSATVNCDVTAGGGTGHFKVALFATNLANTGVGTLLATSTEITNPGRAIHTVTFPTPVRVEKGTYYWLGVCQDASMVWNVSSTGNVIQLTSPVYASWPVSNPGGTMTTSNIPALTVIITPQYNFDCVADAPHDGLTTYVFDSVVGHQDFYGIAARASPAPPATIIAVTTRGLMQRSDAGSRTAAMQVKSGATTVQTTPIQPTSGSFFWFWRTDVTDPNTSVAWTPSAVDAVQVGPCVVS